MYLQRTSAKIRALVASTGLVVGGIFAVDVIAADVIAYTGERYSASQNVTYTRLGDMRVGPDGTVIYWAQVSGAGITSANDGAVIEQRARQRSVRAREGDNAIGRFLLASVADPSYPGRFASEPDDFGNSSIGFSASRVPLDSSQIATRVAHTLVTGGQLTLLLVDNDVTSPTQISTQNTFAAARTPIFAGGEGDGSSGFTTDSISPRLLTFFPQTVMTSSMIPAPRVAGIPLEATFQRTGACSSDRDGNITFVAWVGGPVGGLVQAWYSLRGSVLTTIAVEGQQIPGGLDGQLLRETGQVPIIKGSALGGWVKLSGAGAPAGNDSALMLIDPQGNMRTVVQNGSPAPGTSIAAFSSIDRNITLDARGNVTFWASLLGGGASMPRNTGLWRGAVGTTPTLLVREGDPFPGFGAEFAAFSRRYAGPDGTVYFIATLRGPAVTTANNTALVAVTQEGMQVVQRTGDFIMLPNGSGKIVTSITLGTDAQASGFESASVDGRVGYQVTFADFSSALMLSRVRCPVDINSDGGVDGGDVALFLDALAAGDEQADFNYDGRVDDGDTAEFFARWSAGEC